MKKLFIFALVSLLILPVASAIDAKSYQENMDFSLMRGESMTVPLIVENNDDSDVTNFEFTSSSSWVTFNGEESYNIAMIYHNSDYVLPVKISVPNDAEFGEYIIDIYASGDLFSKIYLDVTVASGVALDMDETMDNLKDSTDDIVDLKEEIDYLKSEVEILTSKMDEEIGAFTENEELFSQLQSEKTELQNELGLLEEKISEEEQKNLEITGMMTGYSAGLGIIIAALILLFLAKKTTFFKEIRKMKPARVKSAGAIEKGADSGIEQKHKKKSDFKYDFTRR